MRISNKRLSLQSGTFFISIRTGMMIANSTNGASSLPMSHDMAAFYQ